MTYRNFQPLTSNRTHFLRMTATSLDWRGATSCFTVNATFLRFFHFSGKDCENTWACEVVVCLVKQQNQMHVCEVTSNSM